jgi:hypothetical protein
MQITGNTILITGGGSGIGRALAEAFHAEGNQVVIAGRRKKLLDEATAANRGMKAAVLDIENSDAIRSFAEQLKKDYPALNERGRYEAGVPEGWRDCQRGGNDRDESAWADPPDCGAAVISSETTKRCNHDRFIWTRVCAAGDDADLLRHEGRDPFLYTIAALPTEEHFCAGPRTHTALRADGIDGSETGKRSERHAAEAIRRERGRCS